MKKLFLVCIMELIDSLYGSRKYYRRIVVEASDAREALKKVDSKENKLESINVREMAETTLHKE